MMMEEHTEKERKERRQDKSEAEYAVHFLDLSHCSYFLHAVEHCSSSGPSSVAERTKTTITGAQKMKQSFTKQSFLGQFSYQNKFTIHYI